MTNPANLMDDFIHRLSVDIFREDVVDNINLSQYYQQSQADAPYYPRYTNLSLHPQSNYISQDLNYQPQQTPTFTTPHHPQYASSSYEITEESSSQVPTASSSVVETPTSSVPPTSMEVRPSEKKRKTVGPSYDAPWWHFYEQIKNASGVMLSGRCKVKIYKVFYRCSKTNGLNTFKKHADKYVAKNVEPQDQPDPRLV
jgi:hypothetical protein